MLPWSLSKGTCGLPPLPAYFQLGLSQLGYTGGLGRAMDVGD